MNQLEYLKKYTTVVVDSGDINYIKKYQPNDATTNPTLILKSVLSNKYNYIIDNSIQYAKDIGGNKLTQVKNASDMISVGFGIEILKYIPGYISTEIDARLSFNTKKCVSKAIKLIKLYNNNGIDTSRVLIKLAATWECIEAARQLKKIGILCNLTLLFSFAQARACADADVFLISPFVGRIYDWYQKFNLNSPYCSNTDPGVIALKKIFFYYKKYGYKTIIMGASFRKLEQIQELVGCDRITISLDLLKQLSMKKDILIKKLDVKKITKVNTKPNALSESEFRFLHNEDAMAVEKLSEGIRQFSSDQQELENFLFDKL
ncbi:transaldolase [Buchnera aphidicola]|uniref:Transaldolase n=1 Tax=Buchnera aphidicola subsp. Cinara cedri (strain Cc) TaxID=372461 RepID=TAL_BUCCC|nr:transaldolase [Buchnera aphidicola]Q058B4.1 RecName: Full=Transaldolase [Buchnera aphidicola BCc]ABJ90535.1 transaldolase A [Buchnera aphidicola BCc]